MRAKVALIIASVIALLFFALGQKRLTLPSWLGGDEKECLYGEERQYSIGLEQPILGGKVVLDKIWLTQNKPDFLRISGRFIGVNPDDAHFFVRSRVREALDGSENGSFSWYWHGAVSVKGNSTEIPFGFEYAAPPIAAKKLFIRIYLEEKNVQSGGHSKLAAVNDFEITNPLRRKPQRWQAESAPALRTVAPLEVHLTKLETGLFDFSDKPGFCESFSKLYLRVLEDGAPTKHWRPMEIRFSAGNGVTFTNGRSMDATAYGNVEAMFDGTLWKCEGPWKVHVTLMRTNNFRAEEIIEISDVPIPAAGEVIKREQQWKIGTNEVQFLGVSGGGVKIPEWRIDNMEKSPAVYFKTSDAKSCWLKLLSISDEQGNNLLSPREEYRRSFYADRPVCFILPKRAARAEKLNFKFGVVWEQREADFVVEPDFSGQTYCPKVE